MYVSGGSRSLACCDAGGQHHHQPAATVASNVFSRTVLSSSVREGFPFSFRYEKKVPFHRPHTPPSRHTAARSRRAKGTARPRRRRRRAAILLILESCSSGRDAPCPAPGLASLMDLAQSTYVHAKNEPALSIFLVPHRRNRRARIQTFTAILVVRVGGSPWCRHRASPRRGALST